MWRNRERRTLLLPGEDVLISLFSWRSKTCSHGGSTVDVSFSVQLCRLLSLTAIQVKLNPRLRTYQLNEEVLRKIVGEPQDLLYPPLRAMGAEPSTYVPSGHRTHFCICYQFDDNWKPLYRDTWSDEALEPECSYCSHWSHNYHFSRTFSVQNEQKLQHRWFHKAFSGCGSEIQRFLQLSQTSQNRSAKPIALAILSGLCLGGHLDLVNLLLQRVRKFSFGEYDRLDLPNPLKAALWSRAPAVIRRVFPLASDKRRTLLDTLSSVPSKDVIEALVKGTSDSTMTTLTATDLESPLVCSTLLSYLGVRWEEGVDMSQAKLKKEWATFSELTEGYLTLFHLLPLSTLEELLKKLSSTDAFFIADHGAFPYVFAALCEAVAVRRNGASLKSTPYVATTSSFDMSVLFTTVRTHVKASNFWARVFIRLIEEHGVISPSDALRCFTVETLSDFPKKLEERDQLRRLMQLVCSDTQRREVDNAKGQIEFLSGGRRLHELLGEIGLPIAERDRIAKVVTDLKGKSFSGLFA